MAAAYRQVRSQGFKGHRVWGLGVKLRPWVEGLSTVDGVWITGQRPETPPMLMPCRQACGAAGRAERAGGTIGRRDPLRPYMDKVMDTLKTAGPEVWADGIARGGGGALARMAGGRGPGRGFGTRGDYGDDSSGDEEDYLSRRDLAALHRALRGGVDTYEREAALYLATVQQYIQVLVAWGYGNFTPLALLPVS